MDKFKLTEVKTTYVVTGVIGSSEIGTHETVALFHTEDRSLADKICDDLNRWRRTYEPGEDFWADYRATIPLDLADLSDDHSPFLDMYDRYEIDPVVGVA